MGLLSRLLGGGEKQDHEKQAVGRDGSTGHKEAAMDYENVERQISAEIGENPVVLYMKGTPTFPQCGFSAAVVQILDYFGLDYKGVDVLADPALRDGIKVYSDWPTIPQLYVKGEFVGGCDIVREMAESGELAKLFADNEIKISPPQG